MGTNRAIDSSAVFPLPAVVGMDLTRQALLLLAIDRNLKGALIACGRGAAKSLIARSSRTLLAGAPFVELPLGVTQDRLLGGLDLEEAILTGRRRIAPGILARAHRGVLYIDEINLLDRKLAAHVAAALNTGIVRLECDGCSAGLPSEFALIGTYDPQEGAVSPALLDSVAIHVTENDDLATQDRIEMLCRVAAFDRDPVNFVQQYAAETALLRDRIVRARSRLPGVKVSLRDRRRLSEAAVRLGVEGNRVDVFSLAVARAHAALMGRGSLEEDDLKTAEDLVLFPRAAILTEQCRQMRAGANPARQPGDQVSAPAPTQQSAAGSQEELVVPALDCAAPEDILSPPRSAPGRDHLRSSGRGRTQSEQTNWRRGRCVRSVPARPEAVEIALAATLRAAAPFQMARSQSAPQPPAIRIAASDLRYKQFKQTAGLLIIFAVDSSGSMAVNRLNEAKGALIRLLGKAYQHRDEVSLIGFRGGGAEVLLPPTRSVELAKRALDDLPAGGATPLAAGIDAALALARRERPARGRQMLLVVLTDGRANVRLEATAPSLSRVNKESVSEPRASESVPSRESIWYEIEQIGAALSAEKIPSVVIDTTRRPVSNGGAARLAELLGGRMVHLPRRGPDSLYGAVAAAVETVRYEFGSCTESSRRR